MTNEDKQDLKGCIRANARSICVIVGFVGGVLFANNSQNSSKIRDLQNSVDEVKAKIDMIMPTKVAQDTSKTNAVAQAVKETNLPQR